MKNFHGKVFFSQGKTNSCGVLIDYFGTEKFTVKKQQADHSGRILILNVSINVSEYILINLYNANTEKEKTEVLRNLFALLKTFDITPKWSPLCSFCNLCGETPLHIFYECDSIQCLWSHLVHYFQNSLVLPILTSQTAIFEFLDSTNSDYNKLLINHILLIFKLYVYRSREK